MQIPGVIVRVLYGKDFGFVKRTDAAVEYFFHRTAVEGAAFDNLRAGQLVTFEESDTTTRGPRANRVIVS